jgi:hypothetical protein
VPPLRDPGPAGIARNAWEPSHFGSGRSAGTRRYERLLGSEPAFFPNDIEAVWAVGERRWFYLVEDVPKAGSALVTVMVADLDAAVEAVRGRGIEPTEFEDDGEARKYVFHGLDGDEIGIGQSRPPRRGTARAHAASRNER